MKNLLKSMALGVGVFSMLALASCSNEESVTNPEPNPAPEGYANVTVIIPGFNDGTRATADVTENKIKELWLCAFKVTGDPTAETKIVNLISTDNTVSDKNWETKGSVTLKHGNYHIYVLANVNDYLTTPIVAYDGTSGTAPDETTISNLALTFDNKMDDLNASSPYLPMACKNTEIKEGTGDTPNTSAVTGGVFAVTENKSLFAEMKLLVAKVRYTILFDLDDYSKNIFSATNVDFENNVAKHVRKTTSWFNPTAESSSDYLSSDYPITLAHKTYPTDTDKLNEYLKLSSSTQTPPDDLDGTWTEGENVRQRAWQGMVYLPENTLDSDNTGSSLYMTALTFNPIANSNLSTAAHEFKYKFERGNYYDIVAKLTKAENTEYQVAVYVKVNPWTYKPELIDEW